MSSHRQPHSHPNHQNTPHNNSSSSSHNLHGGYHDVDKIRTTVDPLSDLGGLPTAANTGTGSANPIHGVSPRQSRRASRGSVGGGIRSLLDLPDTSGNTSSHDANTSSVGGNVLDQMASNASLHRQPQQMAQQMTQKQQQQPTQLTTQRRISGTHLSQFGLVKDDNTNTSSNTTHAAAQSAIHQSAQLQQQQHRKIEPGQSVRRLSNNSANHPNGRNRSSLTIPAGSDPLLQSRSADAHADRIPSGPRVVKRRSVSAGNASNPSNPLTNALDDKIKAAQSVEDHMNGADNSMNAVFFGGVVDDDGANPGMRVGDGGRGVRNSHHLQTPTAGGWSSDGGGGGDLFSSPSPVMIPRSEMKKRREQQQQQQQQQRQQPMIRHLPTEGTPLGDPLLSGGGGSDAHPELFSSPSPVMVPRSEMKKKRLAEQLQSQPQYYSRQQQQQRVHHASAVSSRHNVERTRPTSDPLRAAAAPSPSAPPSEPDPDPDPELTLDDLRPTAPAPSAAPPLASSDESKEEEEEKRRQRKEMEEMHQSNPALAKALWGDEMEHGRWRKPKRRPDGAGASSAEAAVSSSLAGGEAFTAAPSGIGGGRPLPRTVRWRIRLGLLRMPVDDRADRISSSRRSSRAASRRSSYGAVSSRGSAERPQIKRSSSLGRLFSSFGDDDSEEEVTKTNSEKLNQSWAWGGDNVVGGLFDAVDNDVEGGKPSLPTQGGTVRRRSSSTGRLGTEEKRRPSPRGKMVRRNSLSKLLGLGTDEDEDEDDADAGTEMRTPRLSPTSNEPSPKPPLDTHPAICPPFPGALDSISERDLAHHNADMLKRQRERYQELAKRHYWDDNLLLSLHGEDKGTISGSDNESSNLESKNGIVEKEAAAVDPLSALADEREQKKKREEEMDLEYRREKARAHLGLPDADKRKQSKRRDSACGGSRFTDYYSSQEVLDVIQKDLFRLPPEHVERYHRYKLRKLGLDNTVELCFPSKGGAGIGLGEETGDDEDENTKLIRLSRNERAKLLGEVLFVYASEHKALGYRQGFHEILSYLLLALEIDLEAFEDAEKENANAVMLLERSTLRGDLFCMFEAVMGRLSPAYDTNSTKGLPTNLVNDPSLSPMELMGESILAKIRDVAGDGILHRTVTGLGVPPQIYTTRWVRLLFAREVIGYENVFELWESFFDIAAEEEASKRAGGDNTEEKDKEDSWLLSSLCMMDVVECAASAMILLVRQKLLEGQISGSTQVTQANGIETLMNYPPLPRAAPLVDMIKTLIRQQRRDQMTTTATNSRQGYAETMDRYIDRTVPVTESSSPPPSRPKRRNSLSRLIVAIQTGLDGDDGANSTPQNDALSAKAASTHSSDTGTPKSTPDVFISKPDGSDRSNEELASTLGTSVAIIMQHLKDTSLNTPDKESQVPPQVWESLLAINNVGKSLMARDGKFE